jgi:hypothetical protein
MRSFPLRILAAVAALLAVGAASAETYTAQIYSVPAGYARMNVAGAGDNGLMSGSFYTVSGPSQAGYRTATGYKLMHPAGWNRSEILDSWGSTYHCGFGVMTAGGNSRALFWVGGGTAVDIHPAGAEYESSQAVGGGGQQQVGTVFGQIDCENCAIFGTQHAGMWSRTAASFRRLHSHTHQSTMALGTDGVRQVGLGVHRSDGSVNALLWNGPDSYAVNIRPSMSTQSVANSIWGNQQGGYYVSPATSGNRHAMVWANTAVSALDVNPNATFNNSQIEAVRNGLQVGYGRPITQPTRYQAIAWHGTSGSWINLHAKLPAPFNTWYSFAEGIDNFGNVIGYIANPDGDDSRPVIWLKS